MWPFKGKNKSDKLQAKADAKAGVVTAPGDANGQETKDQKENKKDKKSSKKSVSGKNGVDSCNVSILNLSEQLNVAEEAQAQLSQDLQRVTQEKLEIQNQLASLNLEFENMKTSSDQLGQEKWELTQVNNDLQQRLQQTVALARMQAEGNQNRLQEEFQRMMFQLEEERKVTENLSKSLELEKRKVESLEQRAKHNGSSRGSREAENSKRRSSLLPDNVKDAETRLGQSMETYRQRCDNLGNSLHGLLNKLEDERYFGDLATEVNKLRKLLSDEKKKVGGERHKLGEVHAMFETIYDEYSRTVDSLDAAQREIQHKVQQQKQQAVLTSIAKTNIQDNVDSMTVRLMAAEEELAQERRDHASTRERLHHAALELESLPLLQAQVEVYQSDFNAEREARERIAGEKADLEEQLRKAGVHKAQPTAPPPTLGRPRQESQERGGGGYGHQQHHNGGGQYNGRGDGLYHGGGGGRYNGDGGMTGGGWRNNSNQVNNETHRGPMFNNNAVRDRVHNVNNVDAQFENLPATIPTNRPEHGNGKDLEESFTCPKCNREFRNTTLLTRHVNDCLDRDY